MRIRTKLNEVLDERARQFDLFECSGVERQLAAPIEQVWLKQAPEPEPASEAGARAVDPGMAEFGAVLSPTQVDTWLDCQARWLFRYFRKLPERSSASRAFGIAIHRALAENFIQKVETKQDLETEGVVVLFRQAWEEQVPKTLFRPNQDPAEYERQGCDLVRMYMDKIAPSIEPAMVGGKPAVELEVTGVIGGVSARGYIDLVDVQGRIIDLKSSSRTTKEVKPNHRAQLASYKLIGPSLLTGVCRVDQLVRKKTAEVIPLEHQVSAADERLVETIYPLAQAAMRSGLYLPNRSSMYCSRSLCSYWRECMEEFGGDVPV